MTGVLPIPDAALESHLGILGKTGSGKSNAAKVIAEVLMAREERVCAVDPTGTWWGLRLRPNREPSRFNARRRGRYRERPAAALPAGFVTSSGVEAVTRFVANRSALGSAGPAFVAVSLPRLRCLEEAG